MKKKILLSGILFFSIALLIGCVGKETIENAIESAADWEQYAGNSQKIVVNAEDASFKPYEITEQSELDHFSEILSAGAEKWNITKLPKDAEKIISFDLYQYLAETSLKEQKDKELKRVATMTLYSGDYLQMEVINIKLVFKIPKDTTQELIETFTP